MTYDPNETELKDLNSGRLLRAETTLILPMLEQQRESAIGRLCAYFRSGELDKLPVCVAELVSVENMKAAIKTKIAKAEIIERRIFNGNE